MDLVFTCDDATGVLSVPIQPTGERFDFFNADVSVSDINNYFGGYTPYKDLSRRFKANGLFDLNLPTFSLRRPIRWKSSATIRMISSLG